MYRNALFFADRLRSCIWALLPDASGVPKKGSVVPFAGMAEAGDRPGGHPAGRPAVHRPERRHDPAHPLHAAEQRADGGRHGERDVRHCTARGDVQRARLDRRRRGDALTYAWDLDGDNLLDDSTAAQPTFTYRTPGTYTVTLKVTDTGGATALATVMITVTDSGLRTLRFSPIADSRVEAANSSKNYGTADEAAHGRQSPGGKPPALQRRRHHRHGAEREAAPQRPRRRHRRRPGSLHGRKRLDGDGRQVVQPAHVRRDRAG